MWEYLQRHEAFVRAALEGGETRWSELQVFHEKQIRFLQHERLIHLLVMLFVAMFLLVTTGFTLVHPTWPGMALSVLLLVLTAAYVVHYFRLENGVQRWYHLANRIDLERGVVSARYDEAPAP